MNGKTFHKLLSRKLWCTRISVSCAAAVMLSGILVFSQVTKNNRAYLPLIYLCAIGFAVSLSLTLRAFCLCRVRSFQTNGQVVTVHRGIIYNNVYIDGTLRGRVFPMAHYNLVEVWLTNRVRASIYFTRSLLNLAHITFSDDSATITL